MVLDAWRRPSGDSMSWFNMKSYLLLSFVLFKLLDCSRATFLPLWDLVSYVLMLGACYWIGFLTYRYLKRYNFAFQVASYKKAVLITGIRRGFNNCYFVIFFVKLKIVYIFFLKKIYTIAFFFNNNNFISSLTDYLVTSELQVN